LMRSTQKPFSRHPLDSAGDYLAVRLDYGGRSNIRWMIGDAGAYGERRRR
jgi:hypothetical protein